MISPRNYPSRCPGTHKAIAVLERGQSVRIRGRLLEKEGPRGVVQDETGSLECLMLEDIQLDIGDIVELEGDFTDGGLLRVRAAICLTPSVRSYRTGDWTRFHRQDHDVIQNLVARSHILTQIRSFFLERDYIEVETPHLVKYRGCEVHIEQFDTQYIEGKQQQGLYLAPSPELAMKRLLGVGMERIYQLGRCYRNGERSRLHNPEFTMVEWYRAYASYEQMMEETEALVRSVIGCCSTSFQKGIAQDQAWPRIRVRDAFLQWVGVDLEECWERDVLFRQLREAGFGSAQPDDTWEDLFNKALLEKIEPQLKKMEAVFLCDYPAALGAMAKRREGDASWAERVELYVDGVELANGYTELNDPVEQRARFLEARSGCLNEPLDEEFLCAMECGMPPAGGMALGVDRLVMLATGAQRIDDVLPFPLG